jgi:hypothetical protein
MEEKLLNLYWSNANKAKTPVKTPLTADNQIRIV